MSNAGGAGGRALGAVWRAWQGRTGAAKASCACPHPVRLNAPEGNSRKPAQARPDRWPDKPACGQCSGQVRSIPFRQTLCSHLAADGLLRPHTPLVGMEGCLLLFGLQAPHGILHFLLAILFFHCVCKALIDIAFFIQHRQRRLNIV